MVRQRLHYVDGKWIDEKELQQQANARSAAVHTDTIDPTWHPKDGKMYDSKSEFRRTTKRHGLIEYGTEDPRKHCQKPTVSRQDRISSIRDSIERLERGHSAPVMTQREFDSIGRRRK